MNVIVLSKSDVRKVIDLRRTIADVRDVYRMKAEGGTVVWPLVSHDFIEEKGLMDIRSGFVRGKKVHGLKMLNNFPGNAARNLPAFTGMLMVFDSETGIPTGVLDASYITCMRTGAAGALGAHYLAAPDADSLLMLGAGNQSAFLVGASLCLRPNIRRVLIHDPIAMENAEKAAREFGERLKTEFGVDTAGVAFRAEESLEAAVRDCRIVVSATRSRAPLIKKEWVRPGSHFSCIGADAEGKEEIDPALFKGARIFADDIDQCVRVGEMEIPIKQGVIARGDVAGEIGELIAGTKPGRKTAADITIFDATGLALLDLAVAKTVLENAKENNIGLTAEM